MSATSQPVLDLFEDPPTFMVPCCWRCGAQGEPIQTAAIDNWKEASDWAWLAIRAHEREMHPERFTMMVCSGCGCGLGRVDSEANRKALNKVVRDHLDACSGGSTLVAAP